MSQFIEMFGDPMVNDKQWSEYSCISEITQIVLGSTPNSKEPSYWDGDIRWITPAEMTDQSYYIFDTVRHITDEGRKAANLTVLPEGTVLFSTRAPIGKVAIVGKEMCCNQGFKNFICSEKLNNVFLYYTLKLKKDYLCSLGTGTTFKELSKRTVESLKIAVPPIELQNQFETIYKQADKSGFDGRKSQFIEMFGDPMVNDKQWSEYSCISEITQIVLGSTPNSKEPSYWDGDIRWITPAEMTDQSYYIFDTVRHITDEGRKAANLTVLPEGTVLFSTRAPIGKVAIVGKEMCCNQGFKNFICSEKLNNVFLYYTLKLKKDYLCSLGTGTTFKELSKRTVESLKIAVPPIELQNQFETIYKQADKSGFRTS